MRQTLKKQKESKGEFFDWDFEITDSATVIEFLTTDARYDNPETRKGYYSALLYEAEIDTPAWHDYHRAFKLCKDLCIQRSKKQELPESRLAKYLTKDELLTAYEKCKKERMKNYPANYYDRIVLALYIIQAPVRADYVGMRLMNLDSVHDVSDGYKTKKNYCFIGEHDVKFCFNTYKTAKTYGNVWIDAQPEVASLMRTHKSRGEAFVLPEHWNANMLSKKVSALLLQYAGKASSIGLIRHAWVYDCYKNNPTLLEKEALARRMLHSVAVQELYRTAENVEGLSVEEEE